LDVSCIILAGGRSKRLGRNKVTETIGNLSLIETVISRLSEFHNEIIIVTAHDSTIPQLSGYSHVKTIEDIYPGKGTLGGIYSGLVATSTFLNIVVACDMPFLNVNLLRRMVELAADFDVVVPRTQDGVLEPLHAVYSKHCLEPIEYLIKQNRLSVLELYPMVKVKYLEASEIGSFDPDNLSFFNINTEADLATGRDLAHRKDIVNDKP
jgi:molybdopterin-guanine dinucleotide biosynthesis protein A